MKNFTPLRFPVKTSSFNGLDLCKANFIQIFMKKSIYLVLVTIFLLSCSKKDETPESSIKISPPTWVQGEWYLEGEATKSSAFKITSDDFCIGAFNSYSCNKEALATYSKGKMAANVKEVKSDTDYSIEITLASQVTTYNFRKVSATKIKWTNHPLGDLVDAVYVKK
ncbi:hypothetical protein [Pedobacter sp. SL55]|uniref:hypothetical protein n=1 Tax=Pedobacter sp. SL55 TaxID=2995161 RepID=UPI0022704A6E|nr:hypothetical protein [Pedobacter sp. SL55]WAC40907.1 hypothetical protein OVA16_00520 [Pedobacter sp. SL55]